MLLQQATPTKYVCGGKTYTAVQLAEISHGRRHKSLMRQEPKEIAMTFIARTNRGTP